MISKKKTVYYCEYCKKRYMKKDACETHEKHCTANLNRVCRMCEFQQPESYQELIDKYNSQFEVEHEQTDFLIGDFTFTNIINAPGANNILADVGGCPNCALTVIRRLHYPINFDYKNEIDNFWKDRNDN